MLAWVRIERLTHAAWQTSIAWLKNMSCWIYHCPLVELVQGGTPHWLAAAGTQSGMIEYSQIMAKGVLLNKSGIPIPQLASVCINLMMQQAERMVRR